MQTNYFPSVILFVILLVSFFGLRFLATSTSFQLIPKTESHCYFVAFIGSGIAISQSLLATDNTTERAVSNTWCALAL